MRKREKEKKAKEPKTPLYQEWYIDGKGRKLKDVLTSKVALAVLPVFMVLSYFATVLLIGNGAYGYDEKMYENITQALYDGVIKEAGPNVVAIRKVAEYVLYDTENTKKLVANKRNGYFNAEVTVYLSDDFEILKSSRNYDTQKEYINQYWIVFGAGIFAGGLLAWLIVVFLIWYGISVAASISKRKFEKVNETATMPL